MKVAVYGTLRVGGQLHESYLDQTPLGEEVRLNGFDMYSLGAYPYVTPGKGSVVVEVYDVDKATWEEMSDMELRVGYEIAIVKTMFGEAMLFQFSRARHEEIIRKVTSGDWLEYQAERVRKEWLEY